MVRYPESPRAILEPKNVSATHPPMSKLLPLLGRQPPVDLLLHPLTLIGLAVMILNDGWLRGAHPGWITGKLSDFAAVLAYPAVLVTLWAMGAMTADRILARVAPGRGVDYSLRLPVVLGACLLTGVILVGINLWHPFRDGYLALLHHLDLGDWFGPFHYTMDPSDLWALVGLPVVWWLGRRRLARVPVGRLHAVYRRALWRAHQGASPEELRAVVVHGLADVRRARAPATPSLDPVVSLLVEAAALEGAPDSPRDHNVAFDPAEHYHRLQVALKTLRNRGTSP